MKDGDRVKIVAIHPKDAYKPDEKDLIGKFATLRSKRDVILYTAGYYACELRIKGETYFFYAIKIEPTMLTQEQKHMSEQINILASDLTAIDSEDDTEVISELERINSEIIELLDVLEYQSPKGQDYE